MSDSTTFPPTMPVNEIFGPTLQGEGPFTGQPCVFVRFGNCNLHCKYCDTPYTWVFTRAKALHHSAGIIFSKADELYEMSIMSIRTRVQEVRGNSDIVVFSGGEPLLQTVGPLRERSQVRTREASPSQREPLRRDDSLAELAETLVNLGHYIHIETAGTRHPSDRLVRATSHFTVSPKLANSGNQKWNRYQPDVIERFTEMPSQAAFKFVISDYGDIVEVDQVVKTHSIPPAMVWLMPEGVTSATLLERGKWVAQQAIERGYGFTQRLHVLVWGDKRGH